MKRTAIVYWLLPAKAERELFCNVIRILRRAFNAPDFEPHLTLFVTAKNREAPNKVLRKIKSLPIRLRARGVAFSPKFTKTLFVQFKSNPALRKLVVDLGHAAKTSAKTPSDPHVSLLYKKLPHTTKKELAAVMRLPFRTAIFDSIAAVRLTLPVRNNADVKSWRIVASRKLSR